MRINIERLTALSWECNLYVFLFVIAIFCGQNSLLPYIPHIMIVLIGISLVKAAQQSSICIYKSGNMFAVVLLAIAVYIGLQAEFLAYNPDRTMVYCKRYFLYAAVLLFGIKKDIISNILFFSKKYCIIAGLSGVAMTLVKGTKAGGLFGTYHAVGMMMSIACCLFAVEYFTTEEKNIALLKYIISLLCVIVSTKRMFLIISLASFFIVYLITTDRQKSIKLIKAILLATVALVVVFATIPQTQLVLVRIQEMFSGDETVQLSGRNILWEMAMTVYRRFPMFGVGFSNFIDYSGEAFSNPWAGMYHTHSIYYGLICETGIVGCCLFGLLFFAGLVSSFKVLKKCKELEDKDGEILVFQSIILQVWFLIYGLSGNGIYDVNVFLLYVFALMMSNTIKRETSYGYLEVE